MAKPKVPDEEIDDTTPEEEDTPKWAKKIIQLMESITSQEAPQGTQKEEQQIPVPPVPDPPQEESQEESQEEQPKKPTFLKWLF